MKDPKRKRKRLSDEERAELDAAYEETTRLLKERRAWHQARIAEERAAAAAKVARRERLRRLLPF